MSCCSITSSTCFVPGNLTHLQSTVLLYKQCALIKAPITQ
jgi:hypothetical protein